MGKLRPRMQIIYLPRSYRETAARVRLDPMSPDLHYLWKHPVHFSITLVVRELFL